MSNNPLSSPGVNAKNTRADYASSGVGGGLIYDKKVCGVYCYIHRDTLKCYVGSSVNISKRTKAHLYDAETGRGSSFHRNLISLGLDGFDFEIIELCAPSERLEREKLWITFYDSARFGFNVQSDPTTGFDYVCSDDIRNKNRISKTGKKLSDKTKARMRKSAAKRWAEHNANRPKQKTAKRGSAEHISKIIAANKGRKLSEEHRAKIGAFFAGKKQKPEHVAKMKAAVTGKKRSNEAVKNIIAALKRRVIERDAKRGQLFLHQLN